MPEDNRKQNTEEPSTNSYQKHIACSYGYKLVLSMINLVSLLKHTLEKMQPTISLIV